MIDNGADILMLPYFKNERDVEKFLRMVNGRTRTIPLVETPEAVDSIDKILKMDGIDEIFIGLNDLSLGYNKSLCLNFFPMVQLNIYVKNSKAQHSLWVWWYCLVRKGITSI